MIRDQFAMCALSELLANGPLLKARAEIAGSETQSQSNVEVVCKLAYKYADAMMKEREEKK